MIDEGPFLDREYVLDCLLDEARDPGEAAGRFAVRLEPHELERIPWYRRIREYADANGLDPDAET